MWGGLGPYRKYLSGVSYFSIEISSLLRPDIVGSALELPVWANSIDAILMNDVLEHLPDPPRQFGKPFDAFVREGKFSQRLRSSGIFITNPTTITGSPAMGAAPWYLFEKEGFLVSRVEPMGAGFLVSGHAPRGKMVQSRDEALLFPAKKGEALRLVPDRRPGEPVPLVRRPFVDATNRRDVFSFSLLAEKPTGA